MGRLKNASLKNAGLKNDGMLMSYTPVGIDASYQFLELQGEAGAIASGFNIADKLVFPIFRAILDRSSLKNARQGAFFHSEMQVPSLPNLDHKDALAVLQKLISERLIAQIFYITADSSELKLAPCYIARQLKKSESPRLIYDTAISISVRSIEIFLGSLLSRDASQIMDMLADNYNSSDSPLSRFPSIIADPLALLQSASFDLPPAAALLECGRRDLKGEIARSRKLIEILNYGVMPLDPDRPLALFDPARKFLAERLLPDWSNSSKTIGKELRDIDLDEELYRRNPFSSDTARFDVRRAEAIRKAVLSAPDPKRGNFRGSLAIEIVLALKNSAEAFFAEQDQQKITALCQDIRASLFNPSDPGSNAILPISEEWQEEIHPEAWSRLTRDKELFYGAWNQKDRIIHLLIRRNPDVLAILVRDIAGMPSASGWQGIVLGKILEKNRMELGALFESPLFLANYKKMLERVYRPYYPWYYRILLSLGIHIPSKTMFRIAKYRVEDLQRKLGEVNRQRIEEKRRRRDLSIKKAGQDAYWQRIRGRLEALLDQSYMEQETIPLLSDIKRQFTEEEQRELGSLLSSREFQVVPILGRRHSGYDGIVLYGRDQNWPIRLPRINGLVEKIIQKEGESDPDLLVRAKSLRSFLQRPSQKPTAAKTETADSKEADPFERFKQELRKYNARNQQDQQGGSPKTTDSEMQMSSSRVPTATGPFGTPA